MKLVLISTQENRGFTGQRVARRHDTRTTPRPARPPPSASSTTCSEANGYVYEIAAAANFIQVSGTLGEFSPYPNEQEYAALGGFSWDQVIRWRHYT
ncbi:cholera enterotoxin subunit A2 [Colletotrichum salicis]|uniref:Cholera enterotoxin subunit A2 n=1 Tax=Colletotrichum salicis TaxID=1209931 RepID=A0A135UXT5_9PEZI|nr:cholera enterotoxin subunit A2 [Colletotrichum salicis]